jgi:hypothetical protein
VVDLAPIPAISCGCDPHEIVPRALRRRLGWDARHDRTAAQIMTEFELILPRDRELIRQLALMRVAQPDDSDGNGA